MSEVVGSSPLETLYCILFKQAEGDMLLTICHVTMKILQFVHGFVLQIRTLGKTASKFHPCEHPCVFNSYGHLEINPEYWQAFVGV